MGHGSTGERMDVLDEEPEVEIDPSAGQGNVNSLGVIQTFVYGMLTNLSALPAERIHNMLMMVCSDPPYEMSLQQLQKFLDKLVSDGVLDVQDGVYSMKK
jgi:anaphase-promoting complex subunit 2